MTGAESRPRRIAPVVIAALAVGALIRLWFYAARPSLWIDEARVALNIGSRSWGELLRPLDFDQAAPPLFLWVTKLAVLVLGMNEYGLRAVPLLASLAIPPLVFVLADRLAGRRVAVLATVLAAVSPGLVRHAAELKPYQVDAFVALVLIGAFLARRPDHRGFGAPLVLLGAIAVWLSTTAVFVLAAIGIIELWERRRDPAALRALLPAFALWLGSFAGVYAISYRHTAANAYLREFWSPTVLTPDRPGWVVDVWRSMRDVAAEGFVTGALELWASPLTTVALNIGGAVLLLLAGLGVRSLARSRGGRVAMLLTLPWLIVFAASVTGRYPFAPRLTLFALPLLDIAVAAGLVALDGLQRPVRVALATPFVVVFGAGLLWCVDRMAAPGWEDHIRPAVEFFRKEVRPGEPVYVLAGALPAWTFYTTDWQRPDTARLARVAREASAGGLAFENERSRGRRVDGDGAHLVFPYNDWVELLGVYSGARWLSSGELTQRHPDPSWASSEALRIRNAARPTTWVLAGRSLALDRELRGAVEALGGRSGETYVDAYVTITRYRFDPETVSTR
jgi:4-amino-4-deoxy-L-arabinose transferase-like glycosyltransferase